MKKIIMAVLVGFVAINAFCDDIKSAPAVTEKKWYAEAVKKIKFRINSIINPSKSSSVSSVFGIRGNNYDLKNNLYWKNLNSDKLNDKISADKKTIDAVIKSIEAGKTDEAKQMLKDFIKDNPGSYFIDDANSLLNEMSEDSSGIVKDSTTVQAEIKN